MGKPSHNVIQKTGVIIIIRYTQVLDESLKIFIAAIIGIVDVIHVCIDLAVLLGTADERTLFVCSHFSHNGFNVNGHAMTFSELSVEARKRGLSVAYDGMELDI